MWIERSFFTFVLHGSIRSTAEFNRHQSTSQLLKHSCNGRPYYYLAHIQAARDIRKLDGLSMGIIIYKGLFESSICLCTNPFIQYFSKLALKADFVPPYAKCLEHKWLGWIFFSKDLPGEETNILSFSTELPQISILPSDPSSSHDPESPPDKEACPLLVSGCCVFLHLWALSVSRGKHGKRTQPVLLLCAVPSVTLLPSYSSHWSPVGCFGAFGGWAENLKPSSFSFLPIYIISHVQELSLGGWIRQWNKGALQVCFVWSTFHVLVMSNA